jgi:hypothetical protein
MIFISQPRDARIYVAERSKKFLWSIGRAQIPSGPDMRIEASIVPKKIRRQAYRKLAKKRDGHDTLIALHSNDPCVDCASQRAILNDAIILQRARLIRRQLDHAWQVEQLLRRPGSVLRQRDPARQQHLVL